MYTEEQTFSMNSPKVVTMSFVKILSEKKK